MHQLTLKKLKKMMFSLQLEVKIKMVIYLLKKPLLREHLLAIVNNQKKSKKKIVVKDTLKFLTEASSILRENLSSKIISITGSCGKTSLKELTRKIIDKISQTTYSPKSFNNKFGVPLSLFNLKKNDDFGIFEIGMDKKRRN